MQVFPTKGNLIAAKKSLQLARLGFDLMDRKRNILIREMMSLIDVANEIQHRIDTTFAQAYLALQKANVTLGVIDEMVGSVPTEDGLELNYRSVMGVLLPVVKLSPKPVMNYSGYYRSNSLFDEAYIKFDSVKKLSAQLAEIENSVYRLAQGIKKTQKRANALKNVIIPRFEGQVKYISDALEEKEREEFSRLKIIKKIKE